MISQTELQFYTRHGPMTDPRRYLAQVSALPGSLPALVETLQGLAVHIFWAERLGLKLDEARQSEVNLRATWQKLERLLELDPAPLTQPRPLERQLVCNCRDFTVLIVSFLRSQGIPARSRCGFGTYFMPNHYEDHWVAEAWNTGEQRWQMVDAQLTAFMRQVLKIQFDVLDMPRGKFITAGEAWQLGRRGEANPDAFGIFKWHGWNFIRGNVVRDLLALNGIEILPWDFWAFNQPEIEQAAPETWAEIDQIAGLLVDADERFDDLRGFYQEHPLYHAPFFGEYS